MLACWRAYLPRGEFQISAVPSESHYSWGIAHWCIPWPDSLILCLPRQLIDLLLILTPHTLTITASYTSVNPTALFSDPTWHFYYKEYAEIDFNLNLSLLHWGVSCYKPNTNIPSYIYTTKCFCLNTMFRNNNRNIKWWIYESLKEGG